MKRRTKLVFGFVALVALIQIPFVYRRWQTSRLAEKIAAGNAAETAREDPTYKNYSGVIHVHTFLGGHSTATFEDLIVGAKQLDFVVITEHTDKRFDTAAMTLTGHYRGTLFVGGNELNTASGDRLLLVPGTIEAYRKRMTKTPQFLLRFQKEGRLAFVTYPERFRSWDSSFDGIEVFSLNTESRKVVRPSFFLEALWSYRKFPELTLARQYTRPDANLERFDETAKTRRVTLFAGSDAHSNIGFHLFGDDAGRELVNVKLDDYATIFGIVQTHALIERTKHLTQESLLDALRNGHCYIGFEALGDTKGFMFSTGGAIMGDEVPLNSSLNFKVSSSQRSRIVLLQDGVKVHEALDAAEMEFQPRQPGAYRVEVLRDSLGSPFDRLPWIISNPIYVR